jgi:inositol transporter-like SP family MFS transporter
MLTQQREKLDPRYWQLASIAGVASYLDAALLVSAGVALAMWQKQFDLNLWWTGAITAVLAFSVAIGALFGGRLSDRIGRTTVFNVDILVVAIGAVLIAFAPDLPVLVVGLVIAGLGSGADLPTSLAVISERVPPHVQGRMIAFTEIFWVAAIVISQGLGFLVSGMGFGGIRVLFSLIAVVAFITWLIRVKSPAFLKLESDLAADFARDQVDEHSANAQKAYPIGQLLRNPRYLKPLIGLFVFYLFWNLPANTWGTFLNYFLVTVGGRSQGFSTATAFFANILGVLVLFVIYLRYADTKRRYTMMHVGLICCILSFAFSAFFGGAWLVFTICYFVYCAANMLHGEPLYKIWSQQLYPVNARATATGFTYALVRFVSAIFGFLTPSIMAKSPSLLLWMLVGFLCIAYLAAVGVTRFIKNNDIPDPAFSTSPSDLVGLAL